MTEQATTEIEVHEDSRSGTIYWTLSLYIEAEKVASALGLPSGARVDPADFCRLQRDHKPSLALAYAIDPLMNDIADRETHGEVREFLLASTGQDYEDMDDARAAVRRHEDLEFVMPESISWMTEGVTFEARPHGLKSKRKVKLRRFWLSHNDGALSYHMSFSHFYADGVAEAKTGYDPATLYFLSTLQKLAAPKEYALNDEALDRAKRSPTQHVDVFDKEKLGIAPLDDVEIEHPFQRAHGETVRSDRFWPFVAAAFETDAQVLFARLATTCNISKFQKTGGELRAFLLESVPFIEVPGLMAPKSRFMFMLHDKRFFDRLLPLDPMSGAAVSRKEMVQNDCYEPYGDRMSRMKKAVEGQRRAKVRLGDDYWAWVCQRPEYEQALAQDEAFLCENKGFDPKKADTKDNARRLLIRLADDEDDAAGRMKHLVKAMRSGDCFQAVELDDPSAPRPVDQRRLPVIEKRHIPAFEAGRADCLEYLFLAGFNQNIIDFMNQDTSEILDSIDPIYPDSEDQSSDRFFVRYANHRAMITYVPKSRSLEIGNDYIGACPYAFLIHALTLHNEFLARGHEAKTLARIKRIQLMIDGKPLPLEHDEALKVLHEREPLPIRDRFDKAEVAINQAKLATFEQYEKYRYDNPFRYDTERAVFAKLEQLRGINRKEDALAAAIDSLDEHAADIQQRHQRDADKGEGARALILSLLIGATGIFGAGQMFYWIGEKAAGEGGTKAELLSENIKLLDLVEPAEKPRAVATFWGQLPSDAGAGEKILSWTEIAMTGFLAFFFVCSVLYAIYWTVRMVLSTRRWLAEPDYDPASVPWWSLYGGPVNLRRMFSGSARRRSATLRNPHMKTAG